MTEKCGLPDFNHMRKSILTLIIVTAAMSAYAQPKAMGIRLGATGFEADYQHNMNRNQFIEGNLGLDFGYNASGTPGIKATALYNFIWARPAWTDKGSWALYAGPGATIGYVNDNVHYLAADGKNIVSYNDNGLVLGICGQVGLEYTFWFPLQLSVDLRPTVGMHVTGGYRATEPVTGITVSYDPKVGVYDNGFLGFAPTISARYVF